MNKNQLDNATEPRSVDQQQACSAYLEDWAVCDDTGEPKGQCTHCGYKWYDHSLNALPENERESAARIQAERSPPNKQLTDAVRCSARSKLPDASVKHG